MDKTVKASFRPGLKWSIGFNVVLIIIVVFSVVLMVNYLSGDYFLRLHVNINRQHDLCSLTTGFVKSVTNKVNVTIFYDKDEPFFTSVTDLLRQYALINPRISVRTVDYLRDPAAAQKIKASYDFTAQNATNWIIFESEGRRAYVDGNALTQWTLERVQGEKDLQYRRRPLAFIGEEKFTAALLSVSTPKQPKSYYLMGHGERNPLTEYKSFIETVANQGISVAPVSLLGTNTIPSDCSLLIIAGATAPLFTNELQKIEQYLSNGGRLLTLFSFGSLDVRSRTDRTGLDVMLARWGVIVGADFVHDAGHAIRSDSLVVQDFNQKHPLVNPLLDGALYMMIPRPVYKAPSFSESPDGPKVDELAFTGPQGFLLSGSQKGKIPVMAAVEKGAIRNVVTERGVTRILVIGDSMLFSDPEGIKGAMNRAFLGYVVNWLIDRPQLLRGIGPRRISEYKVVMSDSQLQKSEIFLLGGLPGFVLFVGGLVWMRRRH